MRRNGSIAIKYGRVSQETGVTYIPQYRRYPLAVGASAVQTYPCTVALRVSLSASPGNWYSKRNEPTGVPGVTSESRRSRSDSRDRSESSGRIGTWSQPNTRPRKYRRPQIVVATRLDEEADS